MAVARTSTFGGWPSVVLGAGRDRGRDAVEATFLPTLGMLGVSLRFGGREVLSRHGGLDAVLGGHTLGLPLLHPWANRLGGDRYRAGRTTVDLRGAPRIHRDGNGLPIHGTMVGARRWDVVELAADDDRARLMASFPFGDHDDLLASFPFPHEVGVTAVVDRSGLEVTTWVRPTGRRSVPVSFGWHPYLRLPGVARSALAVALPRRRHLELDEHGIPTGRADLEPAAVVPLRHPSPGRSGGTSRTFDDGYEVAPGAVLGLESGGIAVRVEWGDGYPVAQVYAPAGRAFAALEPMTAATNALVTGEHPVVAPGSTFSATFRITATW